MSSYTISREKYHNKPLFYKICGRWWNENDEWWSFLGYRYTCFCGEYFAEYFEIIVSLKDRTVDLITIEPYNGIHGIGFKRHMKSDFCDAIHPVEYYIKK